MRLSRLGAAVLPAMLMCSCSVEEPSEPKDIQPLTGYVQEAEQLYLEETDSSEEYIPLNYENQIGKWFPYMDYEEYMLGKSESEFRAEVAKRYKEAAEQSVNTIYVHVLPCGDAYYKSDIFPKGVCLDGDYDPLQIMLEEAHKLDISVHAWINPLRNRSTAQMEELSDEYIVKQWADNHTGTFVNIVSGRCYLNPAYDEVIDLICRGVDELVQNYNIDGVHIDDYFYPTTAEEFDKSAFSTSGSTDLAQWRISNCNRMVHSMFESVKRADDRLLFGVSPQGNINTNYSTQYADVRLWGSTVGYCDYIVPQLYYGFENETCPFEATLREWESLVTCDRVSLVIGLAAYKQGKNDKWAGVTGELEWIENTDIISRQIELVHSSEKAAGYALYS